MRAARTARPAARAEARSGVRNRGVFLWIARAGEILDPSAPGPVLFESITPIGPYGYLYGPQQRDFFPCEPVKR